MSVKTDASGRRSIQVEVEVPGTPEQVWEAIATGPGVSSWFVPTEIEGREGGAIVSHFGPGMDSKAIVTAWEPPHRFAKEGAGMKPGAPPLGTEWIVEAKAGGTCLVRVVHSLFADTGEWDNQLTGAESGWPAFFRILRLYMTHFAGQPGAQIQTMGIAADFEGWKAVTKALGLANAALGESFESQEGAPPLAGVVDWKGEADHSLLAKVDQPGPGIASLMASGMGGKVYVGVSLYLYGSQAAATVARYEPQWRNWMSQLLGG